MFRVLEGPGFTSSGLTAYGVNRFSECRRGGSLNSKRMTGHFCLGVQVFVIPAAVTSWPPFAAVGPNAFLLHKQWNLS